MGAKKKANKEEGVKLGKILYRKDLTQMQEMALRKLEKSINLNGFRWEIVNGLFDSESMRALLQATLQLNINHLGLANNSLPRIIDDICVFQRYEKLQNLILPGNNIQSIQSLSKLNAPLLWRLNISQNQIHSLRPLSKLSYPRLVILGLASNRIVQIGDSISQLHAPQLHRIDLQDIPELFCFKGIIKMENGGLDELYLWDSGLVITDFQKMKLPFRKRFNPKIYLKLSQDDNDENNSMGSEN